MPSGYGMAGHLGVAKESAWGTAIAATDYLEILSESIAETIERFDVANIVGRLSEPDDMDGLRRYAGDVVFAGHPESLGHFLNGVFGVQSGTEVLSGFLHTHEFTFATAEDGANNPVPPLTLEVFRDVTSAQQYAGGQISALQLAAAPNQDLRVTASMIGKTGVNIAATSPSFPGSSINPFAFDTASVSLGGVATAIVEAFTATFDNQLEGIPSLNNSTEIAKVRRTGPQLVRLAGSVSFEDITDLERFKNQTEFAFAANFTRANSFSCLIEIPRVIYSAFPVGMGDRGRQVISFEGMGRYHTGSAQSAEVTLTTITSGW